MSGGQPKVLIVDDEALYRKAMVEILERSQLEVQFAADAAQAMGVLKSWAPDVILLDVMMPEVSGLTLLRRLRGDSRWKGLPVIIVSARAGQDDKDGAQAAGADAYLTKPFTSSDLRRGLRQFIPILGTAELEAGGDR